jgi:hypothetical protein
MCYKKSERPLKLLQNRAKDERKIRPASLSILIAAFR